FAVVERQRIDEYQLSDPLAHQLGDPAHHHPARAGAHQDDLLQILVEDELRDLVGLGFGGDAGTYRALALAAAVEARGMNLMSRRAQPVRDALPDPAALIRAVHQYECCHLSIPRMIGLMCAAFAIPVPDVAGPHSAALRDCGAQNAVEYLQHG